MSKEPLSPIRVALVGTLIGGSFVAAIYVVVGALRWLFSLI